MKCSFRFSEGVFWRSAWLPKGNSWTSSEWAALTSWFLYVSFLLQMNLPITARAPTMTKITMAITPKTEKTVYHWVFMNFTSQARSPNVTSNNAINQLLLINDKLHLKFVCGCNLPTSMRCDRQYRPVGRVLPARLYLLSKYFWVSFLLACMSKKQNRTNTKRGCAQFWSCFCITLKEQFPDKWPQGKFWPITKRFYPPTTCCLFCLKCQFIYFLWAPK